MSFHLPSLYQLVVAPVYSEQVGSEWKAVQLGTPKSHSVADKQSEAQQAEASSHWGEAAVGDEAPTTRPLSAQQRVAQLHPAWGRLPGHAPVVIARVVAA